MKNDPLDIHALVDNEIEAAHRESLERNVADCPESTREYLAIRELKETVLKHVGPVPADEVWASCAKRIDAISRARRVETFVSKYAWGLCGAFFCVIVAGGLMSRNRMGTQVQSSDLARMMSGLGPFSSSSGASQRPSEYIQQTVGDAPVQQRLENFRSVGQASGVFGGRRVACITLQDSMGRVALIVIENSNGIEDMKPIDGTTDLCRGRYQDLNCVSWTQNGYALMLVGERTDSDLERIASTIRVR